MVEVRGYRRGDEHGIAALLNDVQNAGRSIEQWTRQFADNPCEKRPIIYLADDNGKVIGHEALNTMLMSYLGGDLYAGLSCDTLVHPDYRGQRLATKLFHAATDTAYQEGLSFIYGFPNQNSYHLLVKTLGWSVLGNPIGIVKLLDWHRYLSKRIGQPGIANLAGMVANIIAQPCFTLPRGRSSNVHEIEEIDARFDELWKAAAQSIKVAVVRDARFLRWRLNQVGKHYVIFGFEQGGELLGYVVVRKSDDTGHIVDLLINPASEKSVLMSLLGGAEHYLLEAGCAQISAWIPFIYLNVFRKARYRIRKTAAILCGKELSQSVELAELERIENWYITMIDSDVF